MKGDQPFCNQWSLQVCQCLYVQMLFKKDSHPGPGFQSVKWHAIIIGVWVVVKRKCGSQPNHPTFHCNHAIYNCIFLHLGNYAWTSLLIEDHSIYASFLSFFVFYLQNETLLCKRFTTYVLKYDLMAKENLIVPMDETQSPPPPPPHPLPDDSTDETAMDSEAWVMKQEFKIQWNGYISVKVALWTAFHLKQLC